MKKFLFICFLSVSGIAAADSEPQTMGTSPGIGLAAGWASGIGFAYRQHFDNAWGVQGVAGAFGLRDDAAANLGIELMRTFSLERRIRFYGLAAANLKYVGERRYVYSEAQLPDGQRESFRTLGDWKHTLMPVLGAGLGFEFHFTRHLSWSIELPISVTTQVNRESFEFVSVLPIPSTTLVYQF